MRTGQNLCLKRDLSFPIVLVFTFPFVWFAVCRRDGIRIDFVFFALAFRKFGQHHFIILLPSGNNAGGFSFVDDIFSKTS